MGRTRAEVFQAEGATSGNARRDGKEASGRACGPQDREQERGDAECRPHRSRPHRTLKAAKIAQGDCGSHQCLCG